jgi:hypothetical protein
LYDNLEGGLKIMLWKKLLAGVLTTVGGLLIGAGGSNPTDIISLLMSTGGAVLSGIGTYLATHLS